MNKRDKEKLIERLRTVTVYTPQQLGADRFRYTDGTRAPIHHCILVSVALRDKIIAMLEASA